DVRHRRTGHPGILAQSTRARPQDALTSCTRARRGYFLRDLRMAQARKPTPAAAPTAGRAVFIVSLFAAEPTVPTADEAPDVTLSTTPLDVDAGFGGAGASVAVSVDPVLVVVSAPPSAPLRAGRLIGDGPVPP